MALTLLFFALAERYPERRRLFLLLMYACVGLGVLTKGPVAAALPALVFGIYLRRAPRAETHHRDDDSDRPRRRPRDRRAHGMRRSITATAGPTSPRSSSARTSRATPKGWASNSAAGCRSTCRSSSAIHFPGRSVCSGRRALWLADSAHARRRGTASNDRGFRIRTLLWLWILVIVIFFTFSAAKQDLYIFPIVPAVAALAGLSSRAGTP